MMLLLLLSFIKNISQEEKKQERKINRNYDGESGTDAWNCSICLH